MEEGRTRPDGPVPEGPVKVVVVARDATRLVQYEAALRVSGTPSLATADPDAGADLLVQHRPTVLVLDQGLPRLALFRLYGLARQEEGPTPVQVVFVGQDDDTGPDDHYLPGDPSPSQVAVQVSTLVARLDERDDIDEPGTRPLTAGGARPGPSAAPGAPAVPGAPAAGDPSRPASAQPQASQAPPAQTPPLVGVAARTSGQPAASSEHGTAVADRPAADAGQGDAATPKRAGRRLDVMLVRVGLVLLIIGGLLFFLQLQQASQGPLVTPTSAPSTPARKPSPSPSPSSNLIRPAALLAPSPVAGLTIA